MNPPVLASQKHPLQEKREFEETGQRESCFSYDCMYLRGAECFLLLA